MSKASNKFNFLRDRRDMAEEPEPEDEVLPEKIAEPIIAPPMAKGEADHQPLPKKKMGRPRGKRSDPEYEQVTAYIRRTTYTATKIALLQENKGREFSELVEDLLNEYLSTQKSNNSKV